MPNDDGPPDASTTIDETDLTSIEVAVDALLDNTQKHLSYPFQDSTDGTKKPSATVTYRFDAGIQVSLETSWTLFPGLTLTNIILRTDAAKLRGTPGKASESRDCLVS